MRLPEGIREKLIQEGLVSYLDVKRCVKKFEQEIVLECTNVMKNNIDSLKKKTEATFLDKHWEYQGSSDDGGYYIEVGISGKSENDYISVGVWWEAGIASVYASRYVGASKKLANSLFDKLRGNDLEKDEDERDGWYFYVCKKLPSPRGKDLRNSLNEVLRAWIRIEPKFIELRKKFR